MSEEARSAGLFLTQETQLRADPQTLQLEPWGAACGAMDPGSRRLLLIHSAGAESEKRESRGLAALSRSRMPAHRSSAGTTGTH
jgi:hypothetical protein